MMTHAAPVRALAPSPGARPATLPTRRSAAANPCDLNTFARKVFVSIGRQHVWMCAQHTIAFSAPVTTGAVDLPYDSTPTGNFQIQGRTRNAVLTLLSGARYDVRYWIPFDGPLFGFHDSSWQDFPYGSPRYRTEGSHGCVHMPLAAVRFLYRWADVGTPVKIMKR